MTEFIVAEVSKNWLRNLDSPGFLSERFEEVIEVNRQRGYLLYQFALNQVMVSADEMTETIIAVFRRAEEAKTYPLE